MSSLTHLTTENSDTAEKHKANSCGPLLYTSKKDFQGTVKHWLRYFIVLIPALFSILVSGCGSIDLKRMTYDVLRQQDCLVNEFDEVCTRSFALDYYDYTQVRKEYLQSISHNTTQALADSVLVASAVKVAGENTDAQVGNLSATSSLSQLDANL